MVLALLGTSHHVKQATMWELDGLDTLDDQQKSIIRRGEGPNSHISRSLSKAHAEVS
jgi:hypothetical protein